MRKNIRDDERFMTLNVLQKNSQPINRKSRSKKNEYDYDNFQNKSLVMVGRKGNRMITNHGMKYVYNRKLSNELFKYFDNVKKENDSFIVGDKKVKVLRNERTKTNFNKNTNTLYVNHKDIDIKKMKNFF